MDRDFDVERIGKLLPEVFGAGDCAGWDELDEELGCGVMIYQREAVDRGLLRAAQGWYYDVEKRPMWGARCRCSRCREEFLTGYVNKKGVLLLQGEDIQHYPTFDREQPEAMTYEEGDIVYCPNCGDAVELVRKHSLRSGLTRQLLLVTVEVVEEYAVVLHWLARRTYDVGGEWDAVIPRDAYVICKDGSLVRYCHTKKGQYGETLLSAWKRAALTVDGQQIKYYDHGSCNHRKLGGLVIPYVPSLEGTTGEKTGLREYIRELVECGRDDECWPVVYLKTWKRHRALENLVKAGWSLAVGAAIDKEVSRFAAYHGKTESVNLDNWVDFSKVKPHEMLDMTRKEVKTLGSKWTDSSRVVNYRRLRKLEGCTATEAAAWFTQWRNVEDYISMAEEWSRMPKLRRLLPYLEKQHESLQTYLDYAKAVKRLDMGVTDEVLFPRDLTQAHDRVTAAFAGSGKADEEGFARVAELCEGLTWTDGELMIRVARSKAELIREGKVLRHCVGGYGENHCKGNDVIFFVRRRKRPERSYYTLDIRLNQAEPEWIQLHGYGNERHGENKQYRHKIPKKVKDFCERWEKEILLPRWDQMRQQRQQNMIDFFKEAMNG